MPAECGHDRFVQVIEADVGAELKPSPDRRLGHSHGVIVGKALYEYRFSVAEGQAAIED